MSEQSNAPAPSEPSADCDKPPSGWRCSRERGHEGPCAALPSAPAPDVLRERQCLTPRELIAHEVWTFGVFVDREWADALAAADRIIAHAPPTSEKLPDDLPAVIEGVAVEEMEAWKAARFQHAYAFARKIAARVIDTMAQPLTDTLVEGDDGR